MVVLAMQVVDGERCECRINRYIAGRVDQSLMVAIVLESFETVVSLGSAERALTSVSGSRRSWQLL